jgi:hypothetical protein
MGDRVLRSAAREVYDVVRAATATHRRLRDHLVAIVVATIGIDLLCAITASSEGVTVTVRSEEMLTDRQNSMRIDTDRCPME